MPVIYKQKTKKMLEVENKIDGTIENMLPWMCNQLGATETARQWGISKSTLNYWIRTRGMTTQYVVLGPHDKLEISYGTKT